jgi:6-phosphogluconolactonase
LDIEILADPDAVAARGAALIAEAAANAIAARGRFTLALSGGTTPWAMIRCLAGLPVSWDNVFILQVDERIAPAGSPIRNLTQMMTAFGDVLVRILPMPVEKPSLLIAAHNYAETLESVAGRPPVIDLVHLGLGADGHAASLVPDDRILDVTNVDVSVTGPYQGTRRFSLTFPVLNRARQVLWLVTGADKAAALTRLREGDQTIPAGRIQRDNATLIADRAAAGT